MIGLCPGACSGVDGSNPVFVAIVFAIIALGAFALLMGWISHDD
jgi:hypothetical protein